MTEFDVNGYSIKNLNKINIVLGKNGCGKSSLFRSLEQGMSVDSLGYGKMKYVTPERGGSLVYEANMEQSLLSSIRWLPEQRRRNQSGNFRQQSVAQYKKLETLVLREIEKDKRSDLGYTFDIYVDKVNTLLDNIKIKRQETTFKIYRKSDDVEVSADSISSGESELISLGIECLIFSKEIVAGKENFLFLDEPDVHLHPDLQVRLMHFLVKLVAENDFKIFIATHSTAILGSLESFSDTHVSFLSFGQKEIKFEAVSDIYKKVLPVFGAHPLSNIFNKAPVLLVEGEDDERIWQQVVRSSVGRVKLYPCFVEGVSSMNEYELKVQEIIKAVYDGARGYSLRDRDDGDGEIDDVDSLVRMKLSCRSAENILLADETLALLGINWGELKSKIEEWLVANSSHSRYAAMSNFKEGGFNRRDFDLKDIRNVLMGITGSPKPWEVAVGQAIEKIRWSEGQSYENEGSILSFLGKKVVENLLIANKQT